MINLKESIKNSEIVETKQKNLEIVLSEKGLSSISLSFPSVDESKTVNLRRNLSLRGKVFPIEVTHKGITFSQEIFERELESYLNKFEKHKDSPIFLNKLASLCATCGRYEEAERFYLMAIERSDDAFFVNQLSS